MLNPAVVFASRDCNPGFGSYPPARLRGDRQEPGSESLTRIAPGKATPYSNSASNARRADQAGSAGRDQHPARAASLLEEGIYTSVSLHSLPPIQIFGMGAAVRVSGVEFVCLIPRFATHNKTPS